MNHTEPPDEIAVMRKKIEDDKLRMALVLSIVDPERELGSFPECFVAVLNRISEWKRKAATAETRISKLEVEIEQLKRGR
jgi:hypothetical protein